MTHLQTKTRNVTVLKFGSSVLRSEAQIPAVVNEIYRAVRAGERVVAVVSALGNTTEDLLERGRLFAPRGQTAAVAALLATGEAISAALLELALDRAGVRSTSLCPHQLQLRTAGDRHDAELLDLDRDRLLKSLEEHQVVVVPGFVGVHDDGRPSLLGRGGSDLTALFIAHSIGATRCRLIKDVDGLYQHDPHAAGTLPRRYSRISYDAARELDAAIVQPKAIQFADDHDLPFEVGGIGSTAPTYVGGFTNTLDHLPIEPRPLRVALLGFGTVGYGVYEQLASQPERFEITGIAVRHLAKHLGRGVPDHLLTDDPHELIERDCDVVIELIGAREPATDLIEKALRAGVDVITANKDVLATSGERLLALASAAGATLRFSASVGGALPALEAIRRLAASDSIIEVEGVLNGTCNYIIDAIRAGADLESAIRLAQRAGFAEADPSTDLSGADTAHKLCILVREAFAVDLDPDSIQCSGIAQCDAEDVRAHHRAGSVLRLVARATRNDSGGIDASVQPEYLPADDARSSIQDEENILIVTTATGEILRVHGRGAGRWPTATSVLADLDDLYRLRLPVPTSPVTPTSANGSLTPVLEVL